MLCYREGELSHGAIVFVRGKEMVQHEVRYQNCNLRSMNLILLHILLRGAAIVDSSIQPSSAQGRTVSQIGQFPGQDRPALGFPVPLGTNANLRSDPAVFANTANQFSIYGLFRVRRRASMRVELADRFYYAMLFGTESYKRNPS